MSKYSVFSKQLFYLINVNWLNKKFNLNFTMGLILKSKLIQIGIFLMVIPQVY